MHDEHGSQHQDEAEETRLIRLLRALPVPEPGDGFEQRVLAGALERIPAAPRRHHVGWALATAASVFVAVLVTLQFSTTTPEPPTRPAASPAPISVVQVRPMETRSVELMLQSGRQVDNARLIVELDENLGLEGYSGIHRLDWQTTLKPGANKLSLPVQLLDGRGGEMVVTLVHNDTRKQVRVYVAAATT